MLKFLRFYSNQSKRNIQGRLNNRIPFNISYGKLVITGFVSAGIEYTRKSSSDLTFRMNHLFLSIMHGIQKNLPNMLFAFYIRHEKNMGSNIISAVDRVDFGDYP